MACSRALELIICAPQFNGASNGAHKYTCTAMFNPARDSCPTDVTLAIVGDLEIDRSDPGKVFDEVAPVLRKADIRFGGLEASLSDRGSPAQGKIVMRHSPEMITGYLAGGFEVMAFASNHCLDYGTDAFLDTLELLERHQIR